MKNFVISLFIFVLAFVAWFYINSTHRTPTPLVTSFEECSQAGYPIKETYPRQCSTGDHIYVEPARDELKKNDLIRVTTPLPNQMISSPLTIIGEARGSWFFEASFPIVITDWDGRIIANGVAQAKGDWMTADFVPFEATVLFTTDKNTYSNKGTLILRKDNPSGLSENDNSLEIPVIFAVKSISTTTPPQPIDCTQEAKLCVDGSYVRRTGPKCEFATCPNNGLILPNNSGIRGTISSGPTCPVQKIPPDPNCADKPVTTNISVYRAVDTAHSIAILESSADGTFEISLPKGDYIVMAGPYGVSFPRCPSTSVTVVASGYTQIKISCDTGIR